MTDKSESLIKKIIIPKISDDCNLYFAQNVEHIPFAIKRVYFITGSKKNLPRGYHAHHRTQQVLFCIQGSVKMIFNNGFKKQQITLTKPEVGVLIDKKIWHEMHDIKINTILLVLTSARYDPKDYIREYSQYIRMVKNETDKV